MKVTLETSSPIKRCLTVEVPSEDVDKAYSQALRKLRDEVNVPGFRKGKVPDAIISQRFGDDLRLETIKQLAGATCPEALREVNAHPLATPEIEPIGKVEKGKAFTYKARFEVYPEFTATAYDGLKLEKEKVGVTKDEIEAELKRLQRQMTQLEPAPEAELGPGMVATIDFASAAAGVVEGSETKDYFVDFGSGSLLSEFEVEIKGMKTKEERKISFKYPDDYFKKEVAGKRGEFRVKVKDVRRKLVPEMTDEFASELGSFKSLDEVRADIERSLGEFKESVARAKLREQAIRILIEKHKDLEVPVPIIDAELGNMLSQLDQTLKARGQTLEDAKIDPKEFVSANLKEATDRARGYMVVSAIAKQEKIEATEADTEARIAAMAAQTREAPAKVRARIEKDDLMGNIRSRIVFEKALDFVLNKAKITEVRPKSDS